MPDLLPLLGELRALKARLRAVVNPIPRHKRNYNMPKKTKRAARDLAMRAAMFSTLSEQLHAAAAIRAERVVLFEAQQLHRKTLAEKAAAYDKLVQDDEPGREPAILRRGRRYQQMKEQLQNRFMDRTPSAAAYEELVGVLRGFSIGLTSEKEA